MTEPLESVLVAADQIIIDARDPLVTNDEFGNSNRYVEEYATDHKHLSDIDQWIDWDESEDKWMPDEDGNRYLLYEALTDKIYEDGARLAYPEDAEGELILDDDLSEEQKIERGEGKALMKWATRSRTVGRRNAVLNHAAAKREIKMLSESTDRDAYYLGVGGGVIDLRTLQPVDHLTAREAFITKSTKVKFDLDAKCPTIDYQLLWMWQDDEEMVAFMWRLFGYTLWGDSSERIIVSMYGPEARNGKSTVLNLLERLTGDYGTIMHHKDFERTSGRAGSAAAYITQLQGKRFVGIDEIPADFNPDVAFLKRLAGSTLSGRGLYQAKDTVFRSTVTPWFASNHYMKLQVDDAGAFDRMISLLCESRLSDEDVDKTIEDRLMAEISGFQTRAFLGCLEWLEDGLQIPQRVRDAGVAYRTAVDTFQPFLDTLIEEGWAQDNWTSTKLLNHYLLTSSSHGGEKLNTKGFAAAMRSHGYSQAGNKHVWTKG